MQSRQERIKSKSKLIKAHLNNLKLNHFKVRKRHLQCKNICNLNTNSNLISIKAFDIANFIFNHYLFINKL